MKKPVYYEPPGWEGQEVAKDIDRLVGEGGKNESWFDGFSVASAWEWR